MIKRVKYLKPGERFYFAGVEWIKLEDLEDGAKCIAANNIEFMEFDQENKNDWKGSTLRKYLHNEFFNYLKKQGAELEDFLTITSELISDDGLKDYGTSEDKIALITCDDYRKYRNHIPTTDGWWWTITPWSCDPSNSYSVRVVITSGALYHNRACGGGYGVRPLIKLNNKTEVKKVEGEETQTLDDLARKIKSIIESLETLLETFEI